MKHFLSELSKFRRRWKRDQFRSLSVEFGGWLILLWAVLCWLDLLLAFEPLVRIILSVLCMSGLVIWLGVRIARVARIGAEESAVFADNLLKSRRQVVLTALEIGKNETERSPIGAYLARQGIKSAGKKLQTLHHIRLLPLPQMLLRRFIIILAITLIPAFINPNAARTLLQRYIVPYGDIPPYSDYEFTITPEIPEVIYGSDLVINVEVSGKKIREPVRFATRKEGRILESECFQANPNAFVQRLEKVMQPMEFCFLLGKARSKWHKIRVLYQPHFISANITLTPPAYSGQKTKDFPLGTAPLTGLKGSSVEMTLQSNRPLKKGELTITPEVADKHAQTITGKITGENEITYKWQIFSNARLSVMINDIQGTPAKEPMKIIQNLMVDEKPAAILSEPMAFSLATPKIKIPIVASIEDDLGVKRCDIHRTLKGYHSRSVSLDVVQGADEHEIRNEIDLLRLGVKPGQVLELFLEVSDTNPDLTGTGSSDIARIKVISEEEYAQLVRTQTTIASFESRFQQISAHYYGLIEQLEKTKSQLKKDQLSNEELKKQKQQLQSRIQSAIDEISKLADDFAAYDLEEKLSESASRMTEDLKNSLSHSGWKVSDQKSFEEVVENSLNLIKKLDQENKQLQEDGEEVAAVGRVMAMGAWYKAIIDRQMILVSTLQRYAAGERKSSIPKVLAKNQASIKNDLNRLLENLNERVKELPPGYENLRKSALEFIKKVRKKDITSPMIASEKAALNELPREAWRYALDALERMQDVLQQCKGNSFAQVCSGNIGFKVPQNLSRTMSQMLESLMNQYSHGVGWGSGTGSAGVGIAGAWEGSYMNGYSAFDMPIYGPERRNPFSSAATGGKTDGPGSGAGSSIGHTVQYSEKIVETEKDQTGGKSYFKESVPPKYRDAVKSFYNEEE